MIAKREPHAVPCTADHRDGHDPLKCLNCSLERIRLEVIDDYTRCGCDGAHVDGEMTYSECAMHKKARGV